MSPIVKKLICEFGTNEAHCFRDNYTLAGGARLRVADFEAAMQTIAA